MAHVYVVFEETERGANTHLLGVYTTHLLALRKLNDVISRRKMVGVEYFKSEKGIEALLKAANEDSSDAAGFAVASSKNGDELIVFLCELDNLRT